MNNEQSKINNLLEKLSQAEITLWSDGGQLRFRGPKGALTLALKEELKKHKEAILAMLDRSTSPSPLNLSSFYQKPTLASLNQVLATALDGGETEENAIAKTATTEELVQEARAQLQDFPSSINFSPIQEPQEIFLTGATGFLGIYLLYELLVQTQAVIYCLVRAPNLEAGKERLRAKFKSYDLDHDAWEFRVVPVLGDLNEPLLGLSEEKFQTLAQTVDVIYHNGALVNFLYPYTALKAANVGGTHEILKLAITHKIKPVHYISTIGVFLSSHLIPHQVVYEQDSLDHGGTLYGGYAQSKWVAEKLVSLAGERGLPISIYRPGTITGHSQTGACSTQDWLSLTLKSSVLLEMIPELETMLEMTPVDYVSGTIVHLSQQTSSLQQCFHLVNPQTSPWNQLVDFLRSFGYPVQLVSFEQWKQKIETYTIESSTSLASLLPLLQSHGDGNQVTFDTQNVLQALAESPITCPPVSSQLLKTQLSYFIRNNFLTAPTATLSKSQA